MTYMFEGKQYIVVAVGDEDIRPSTWRWDCRDDGAVLGEDTVTSPI